MIVLDTNVISEIRKRDRTNPNVARWVARTPVTDMGTSVLVLAEIRHGIEPGNRARLQNRFRTAMIPYHHWVVARGFRFE